jgi:hypothetical protein
MPRDDRLQPPDRQQLAGATVRKRHPLVEIKTQRTLAKAGVLATLGILVWTGMQRPRRRYMPLHTWTGMALIGLTLWHWSLYMPRSEKPARNPMSARLPTPQASEG